MKSKTKIILLLTVLSYSIGAEAQTEIKNKEAQLVFFASVGYKYVNFENLSSKLNNLGMVSPTNAFNLGAGMFFNHKSMIYGLDFYNSSGNVENEISKTKFSAFTYSVFVGYKALDKSAFMFAPIIGVSTSSNSISVYNKSLTSNIFTNANAYTLNNFDFSARLGFMLETIAPNGLSVGITTGYDFSLIRDSEWGIEGLETESGVFDNQGGFFVNLTLGGHLFMKKSDK